MKKQRGKKKISKKISISSMNKTQLLAKAKELSKKTKTNIKFTNRMKIVTLREHVRNMMRTIHKPVTRLDEAGKAVPHDIHVKAPQPSKMFQAVQEVYAEGKKEIDFTKLSSALQHQISVLQGQRHQVGDSVIYDSPVARMMGINGTYMVVAVLEEAYDMCGYFLEGIDMPVEGRHLKPMLKATELDFS